MEQIINIRITKKIQSKLGELKVHPRQSYLEIIEKLLEEQKNGN